MEFPDTGKLGICNNKMALPETSSQPEAMRIEDLTSINIEEFMASIPDDKNEFQELGIFNPNEQLDNTPKTLSEIFEEIQLDQTQVQAPQWLNGIPNTDLQSLSQQQSPDEMTLEEFLIGLGVIRASSPTLCSQPEVQGHGGAVLGANNSNLEFGIGDGGNGRDFPLGGSLALGPTGIGSQVSYGRNMAPIRVSSYEANWTIQSPASMVTHNARQHRRMIRTRHRHQENHTTKRMRGTSSRTMSEQNHN